MVYVSNGHKGKTEYSTKGIVDFWVVEGLKTRHTDESYHSFAARSVAISVKELSRVNKMAVILIL